MNDDVDKISRFVTITLDRSATANAFKDDTLNKIKTDLKKEKLNGQ